MGLAVSEKLISLPHKCHPRVQTLARQDIEFEQWVGNHSNSPVRKRLCLSKKSLRQIPSGQNSDAPPCTPYCLYLKPLFFRSGEGGHNNNNNRRIMEMEKFAQTRKNNESPGCLLRQQLEANTPTFSLSLAPSYTHSHKYTHTRHCHLCWEAIFKNMENRKASFKPT